MKKIVAILLFAILLFNLVGYRFLFNFFEQNSVNELDQKIYSQAFNDEQLKEISIPLNMPYYSDKQMENVNGEFKINGLHYQYVKRKIENNVLHIWCLPNIQRNNLDEAKNDVATSNNQQPNHSKNSTLIKLLQTEFLPLQTITIISHTIVDKTIVVASNYLCLSQFKPGCIPQPPEFFC